MRIIIFGRPGSGKSTFAFALSKMLNLPLYHLDKYFFVANWVERDYGEFLDIQQKIVDQDAWIIDGCSLRSLEMRYARADVCLFFLYPRVRCIFRLFKRMFDKNPAIQDRPEGCSESISWKLIKYAWTFEYRHNNRLPKQLEYLRKEYPHIIFYTIKNDCDLERVRSKICGK